MPAGHRSVATSGGCVEVVVQGAPGDAVLYFHGGHESATAIPAAAIYRELGHRVVAVSRPGYGSTDVGPLSPAAFAPLVDEVRADLGTERFVAVVGTSFGGPQAVEYAGRFPDRTGGLVLHSAAPSTLPYPDSALQRLGAPFAFHPRVERRTWRAVTGLLRVAPDRGLRTMTAPLSTLPVSSWLPALDAADRQELRDVFTGMRSGSGFLNDVRHAGRRGSAARREAQQRVACPTLVTASRHDGGVSWRHAEDFRDTVPGARLVELPAPSHLFWIGPARALLTATVADFLGGLPGGRA